MAKAKSQPARKPTKTEKRPPATRTRSASPRPAASRAAAARKGNGTAMTRVTRETEVRGTETRVERRVERAPKPSLPDVDRASGARGRYVYCIIRASQALKFGAIGMDDQSPEVYTITYRDMAAVVSDVPIAPRSIRRVKTSWRTNG
jgi:hypothetical protein